MVESIPPPVNATSAATASLQSTPPDEATVIATIIASVPDVYAELTRPVQIGGIIANLLNNGAFTLQTAAGDIALSLAPQATLVKNEIQLQLEQLLQSQRPLHIVIEPGNPPTQGLITLPPLTDHTAPLAAATTGTTVNTPTASAPFDKAPTPGALLTAIILPKDSAASPTHLVTTAPPFSAKFEFTPPAAPNLTSNAASLPSPPGKSAAFFPSSEPSILAAPPPHAETASASASSAKIAQSQTSQQLLLSQRLAGSELQFRLAAVVPAGVELSEKPDQFVATVTGKGAGGQMILSLGDTTLFVRAGPSLPEGSRLLLEPLAPKTPGSYALPARDDSAAPELQQLMAALHQLDPSLAAQTQSRIPQPGNQMPSALLFFFNAFQQGGVPAWLGEAATARLEQAGKRDLVKRLTSALQQASETTRDPAVGEWRSYPLPLHHNHQFQNLHLYVHQDQGRAAQGSAEQRSSKTRFLIDFTLSRLGPLQMDGLVQRQQLDLIVRSEHALPAELPAELRATWIKTLEALNLAGTIQFQTGRQNWLNLKRQTTLPTGGVMM